MATTAQIAANRSNAQHSTGPRSLEGKQASAANSTKHGLAAGFAVLPHENEQEYRDLQARYKAEFAPNSAHEEFLIAEMCNARWRLARARRLETALMSIFMGETVCRFDQGILEGMKEHCADLPAALARYAAAAERSCHRAHKELTSGRTTQIQNEAKQAKIARTVNTRTQSDDHRSKPDAKAPDRTSHATSNEQLATSAQQLATFLPPPEETATLNRLK